MGLDIASSSYIDHFYPLIGWREGHHANPSKSITEVVNKPNEKLAWLEDNPGLLIDDLSRNHHREETTLYDDVIRTLNLKYSWKFGSFQGTEISPRIHAREKRSEIHRFDRRKCRFGSLSGGWWMSRA